ncbi:LysR family transcriptional regulator [Paenibacillus protaetiae]|uniref:LysR family transcriptional regulator n=1 Tax=Paenibacillus protaetiae TaxID=2509456 RepID=A0A4P6F5Q0_9BACL|nr:LysR family transcriptional regulator [Paenibacillus protaetiae]QAY65728.1 LysR family transcriptional regulator [Paenibacillus protaetiae]
MDIRHLKYFTAVAQNGSFTRAAEELHISQPTLSKMVRLLEQELEVELFDRSAKQIELTDAGKTILRSSLHIMNAMENMQLELQDVVHLERGTLRLGMPPMIGGKFFATIIEKFHLRYPKVDIKVEEKGGKSIETHVESGELDAGIVILPVETASLFYMQPLLEERLMVVTDRDHRLAGEKRVTLTELEEEPFILFVQDFRLHHLVKEACLKTGYTPKIVFESSQWDFMTEMVAARLGITLLPETVCHSLDTKRFAVIELDHTDLRWRLAMIWNKEKYMSFVGREWVKFVQEHFDRQEERAEG